MRWRGPGLVALAGGVAVLLAVSGALGPRRGDIGLEGGMSVREALGGEADAGFARADTVRRFSFPEDHGPHPDFRTEWWYVTGNLAAADGRRFGMQLTVFRTGLAPGADTAQGWRTHQVYMGHFGFTEVEARRHQAFERFSRGALGLAGARTTPFRVWIHDWVLEGTGSGPFPARLEAMEDGTGVELRLDAVKPLTLQGRSGLSRKGSGPGNASYYYSYTRLAARGTVFVAGRPVAVEGTAWMDREWSTSALSAGQVGWDWFALQLDDGRDLMFYRMRREDATPDPFSAGSLVDTEGRVTTLAWHEVSLDEAAHWTSPLDGTHYPVAWRMAVPSADLELEIEAQIPGQEMDLTFRYWEGAVRVSGSSGGRPITGVGYAELTGYADAGAPAGGTRGPARR